MSKELQQLNSLLEYVKKIGELHQKIIFKIEDYKKVFIYEDTLQDIKGLHFNTTNNDNGEPIWLKIDRLKRTDPPIIDEDLKDWIVISKDPNNQPIINSILIKTLTQKEKLSELEKGFLLKEDVKEPLKNDTSSINLFDVIYKIENLPHIKQRLDDYIQDKWYKWQLREIPFRKSIEIYEQFFNRLLAKLNMRPASTYQN